MGAVPYPLLVISHLARRETREKMGFLKEKMSSQQMAQPPSEDYKPLWESFLYG